MPTSASSSSVSSSRLWLIFAGWLAIALTAAAGDLFAHLPERALPLVIWFPVLVAVIASRLSPAFRAGLGRLNVRAIVLAHGIRAGIGVAFLVEASRGVLPAAFGRPAGWGDLVVGAFAIALAAAARPDQPGGRRLLRAWNVVGFVDILMAFVSAQRLVLFVHDPRMAATLGRLPYSLVPLVVLPFVLSTHLWLFGRLSAGARRPAPPSTR